LSIANPLHKADLAAVEELTEVRTGWVGRDGGGRGLSSSFHRQRIRLLAASTKKEPNWERLIRKKNSCS